MGFWEVLLLGVALSMDAAAVGMSSGMCQKKYGLGKALLTGGFFGGFQALMPLVGYFLAGLITSAFLSAFEYVSSILSFVLLAFLGGRMIFGAVKEWIAAKKEKDGGQVSGEHCPVQEETLTVSKLLVQAVATSIDAFAVGVALQMEAVSGNFPFGIFPSVAVIGCTTLFLTVAAVYIGKLLGNKLADKASFFGGVVLVAIGIKLLIEGFI